MPPSSRRRLRSQPRLDTPRIWIIVPTYNERDNVGPITEAILATVPRRMS
jgi:hypothetical protein